MGTKNNPGEFDCYAAAKPDEPMFILLGRDEDAADLVYQWACRRLARLEFGPSLPDDEAERKRRKIDEAFRCAGAMRAWADRLAE